MNIPLTPVRFLERTLKIHGKKTGVVCRENRFTYALFPKTNVKEIPSRLLFCQFTGN